MDLNVFYDHECFQFDKYIGSYNRNVYVVGYLWYEVIQKGFSLCGIESFCL